MLLRFTQSSIKNGIIGKSLTTSVHNNYNFVQQVNLATLINLLSLISEPCNIESYLAEVIGLFPVTVIYGSRFTSPNAIHITKKKDLYLYILPI